MSDFEFKSILEKLTLLESDLTPTTVKSGLNKQQKSVPQLPALFKPKHISVLNAKTDPKHPMSGYAVGGCEESEEMDDEEMVDEWMNSAPEEPIQNELKPVKEGKVDEEVSQDVLAKVKQSFTDYLKNLEDSIKQDKDLIAKKKQDLDLKKKELKDLDLQQKKQEELEEDPTQEEPTGSATGELNNPTYAESISPVKTVALDEDTVFEIFGDEGSGFSIRRGDRALPTVFNSLSDAEIALDTFRARHAKKLQQDASQDYIEEK